MDDMDGDGRTRINTDGHGLTRTGADGGDLGDWWRMGDDGASPILRGTGNEGRGTLADRHKDETAMAVPMLSEETVAALQPFFPELDLRRVAVRIGVPWPVRVFGAVAPAAFAGPRRLYFKAGHFDPETVVGLAIIAHELKHVEQYRRLGTVRFVVAYVREYLGNRRAGLSRAEAYRSVSFEREAYEFEAHVRAVLEERAPEA